MVGSAVAILPDSARAEQARALAEQGVEVTVRDYAVKGYGLRTLPCLHLWSRSPTPWWERFDPYWNTRVFNSQRGWVSGNQTAALNAAQSFGRVYQTGDPGAIQHNVYTRNMPELLRIAETLTGEPYRRFVSILRGAGRALSGQLAALAGIKSERSGRAAREALRPLMDAEIIERAWHHSPGIPWPRAETWQIKDGRVYNHWARHIIEQGDLATVYGCMRPVLSARSDTHRTRHTRHQVLAVELALRALETSDLWAGWMPETACRPEWFLPPEHPMKNKPTNVISDGCLIRFDGARIFLEIEASVSQKQHIKDKIVAWSHMLDSGRTGAAVLFVAAALPSQLPAGVRALKHAIREHAIPSVHDRMLVGSWHDYSPDFGLVTPDAASLRAGMLGRHGAWSETHAGNVTLENTDTQLSSRVHELSFIPGWAQKCLPV